MIKYKVIEEVRKNSVHGTYTTYGVCGYQLSGEIIQEVLYISDIFLNKSVAQQFVEQCNRGGLEIVHLQNVVEDVLV